MCCVCCAARIWNMCSTVLWEEPWLYYAHCQQLQYGMAVFVKSFNIIQSFRSFTSSYCNNVKLIT